MLELRDAIDLGDAVERAIGGRGTDAYALRSQVEERSVALESGFLECMLGRYHEQTCHAIEVAQSLVTQVLRRIEVTHLGHVGMREARIGEHAARPRKSALLGRL